VVPDLDEGTYRIAVTLNGYVKQEYGQRSFTGQGTTLTVGKGEALVLKDPIRMTRAGNISGRLTDNNGQPASGVPVQVLRVTYNAQGIRLFQAAGTSRTNDRGEYRLYWLTPGRYYLIAGTPPGPAPGQGPGGPPSPNETPDPFVLTYYPGTTDLSRASIVDVKAGSDSPMDFVVPRTQLFKIRGRVIGANNGPNAPQVGLSLGFLRVEGGSGFITQTQTYNSATGTFVFRNVVPGSYALQANAGATAARAAVEVVNSDVEVDLNLSGGVSIEGKVQIAGGGALPSGPGNNVNVQFRPIMKGVTHWVGAVPGAPVTPADGTFRLDRVLPGEYRPVVAALGHYVKELRFESRDVLGSTIELSDDRPDATRLEVVLSPAVGQIDGFVTDDKGQPMLGVQAVLIPNQNRGRTELFKAAATDQSGRFSMKDFGYFEPSFIAPYEALGKAVKVDEGARLNLETKVIPEKR
jgi:5-hydroxyisourate hydrolase-like protein (transthyretin family)